MRFGSALVVVAVGFVGSTTPGCFSNTCLVTVCDGPYCHCSVATCGEGASYDARIGRCRCLAGRALVGGHCLAQSVADTYCGRGYRYQNGGCYHDQCRPGDELDHATGMCIPHEQVNKVASNLGISVGPGQKLGCPEGQKLVIDGQNAACVPLEQTCARDETWDGKACVKVQITCPEGSAWDAVQKRCVEFAHESPTEVLAVNVGQWAFANYGPDGGAGVPSFCNAFAKKPWSFGVNEGSSVFVKVSVSMLFPETQIARGHLETRTVFAASGNAVPPKGASEADAAAQAVLAPLVQQGGRASAERAATTVRCLITNAARPQAIPATGGL